MRTNFKPFNKKLLAIGIAATLCGSMYYTQPIYAAAIKLGAGEYGTSVPVVTTNGTSIGIGDSTTQAQEQNSIAIGIGSISRLVNSTVLGIGSSANKTGTVAYGSDTLIGNNNTLTDASKIGVLGESNTITGNAKTNNANKSTVIGSGNTINVSAAEGLNYFKSSTVIGTDNKKISNLESSFVLGNQNTMTGSGTESVLFQTHSKMTDSFLIGNSNSMIDTRSVAVIGGGNTVENSYTSLVTGINNTLKNASASSILGISNRIILDNAPQTFFGIASNEVQNNIIGYSNSIMGTSVLNTVIGSKNNLKGTSSKNFIAGFNNSNKTGENITNNQIIGNDWTVGVSIANSVLLGNSNTLNTSKAVVIGYGNSINGTTSVAVGNENNINSNNVFVLGNNVTVSGNLNGAVVLGNNSAVESAVHVNNSKVGVITYGNFAGSTPAVGDVISVGSTTAPRQIQNVAAGQITAASLDAINGSQLYATQTVISNVVDSVKDVLGGNATVGSDGKLSMSNIGDTGKGNINDAIKEAYKKAGEAGKVAGSGKDGKDGSNGSDGASITGPTGKDGLNGKDLTDKTNALRNGEAGTMVYTNTDGDRVVKGNDGNYYLSNDVNDQGEVTKGAAVQKTKLTAVNPNGLTTAPIQISNVAKGTSDSDAVNYAQLKEVEAKASAHTTVKAGDNNITVTEGANTANGKEYTLALSKDLTADSLTTGNSKLNTSGLTITGGPSVTTTGIDAGNKVITNVADGAIAANSKEAVNGGQLFGVYSQAQGNTVALGGGAQYDFTTNTYTAPTYNVTNTKGQVVAARDVGSAIDVLNQGVVSNTHNINNIYNTMGNMNHDIGRAGAAASALAALNPMSYDPNNKTQIMAGFGHYRDQQAFALGIAHYDTDKLMYNFGVSYEGQHVGFNAGLTWKFGHSKTLVAQATDSPQTIALKNKVIEMQTKLDNMEKKLEALLKAKQQ